MKITDTSLLHYIIVAQQYLSPTPVMRQLYFNARSKKKYHILCSPQPAILSKQRAFIQAKIYFGKLQHPYRGPQPTPIYSASPRKHS